ncbi:MAG: MFS transporter [Desulfocapsaceae bacterium]|nr:MFS transporter [Desulfocapsaceae bacterium]
MSIPHQHSDATRESLGRSVRGILFLAFLFFLNFLSRIIFAPLLPLIKEEFWLTISQSGSLFFFISAGYFISVSMSGFVSARVNHANTIFLSSLAASLALFLVTFLPSFPLFCAGLFILGLAAGLYLPSGLSTIYTGVPRTFLARGIAIHELAPNLGFIMAPLLWLAASFFLSWRQCLMTLSAMLLFTGVLYRFSSFPSRAKGVQPDLKLIISLGKDIRFWLLVYFFSFAICSTLGLYAMLPLFLVNNHGMTADTANYLVSITRVCSLFTPFLGGWLGDRFGNTKVMATILICGGMLTVWLGLSSGILLIFLLTVQAMVAVCFFPSGLAVLTSFSLDDRENVAVPFCIPIGFVVGGGVLPFVIGLIGDVTSLNMGIVVAGIAIFGTGIAALFLAHEILAERR